MELNVRNDSLGNTTFWKLRRKSHGKVKPLNCHTGGYDTMWQTWPLYVTSVNVFEHMSLSALSFLISFWVWNPLIKWSFFLCLLQHYIRFLSLLGQKYHKPAGLITAMYCLSQSWEPASPWSSHARTDFFWRVYLQVSEAACSLSVPLSPFTGSSDTLD